MPWFLCSYKRDPEIPRARYCQFEDFYEALTKEGAVWGTVEIDNGQALVKVDCSDSLANEIAATRGCTRLAEKILPEIRAWLGAQLTQRHKVRWDQATQSIVATSEIVPIANRVLDDLDTKVSRLGVPR